MNKNKTRRLPVIYQWQLITTQIQKLEALKAYKKGLMQQLFPAEGEDGAQSCDSLSFVGSQGSGKSFQIEGT